MGRKKTSRRATGSVPFWIGGARSVQSVVTYCAVSGSVMVARVAPWGGVQLMVPSPRGVWSLMLVVPDGVMRMVDGTLWVAAAVAARGLVVEGVVCCSSSSHHHAIVFRSGCTAVAFSLWAMLSCRPKIVRISACVCGNSDDFLPIFRAACRRVAPLSAAAALHGLLR